LLATVGLDTGSLGYLQADEPTTEELAHRMLLRLLQAHGVVVFAQDHDKERFFAALRNLPGSIRKLWSSSWDSIAHITSQRPIPLTVEELIDQGDELATTWNGFVGVVLAERDRAERLGLPLTVSSVFSSCGIELARMEHAESSQVFCGLQQLAYEALHAGEDRETAWRERFAPIANHAASATIVDRYAISAHQGRRAKDNVSGLEWILQKVGEAGVPHVHLITQAARSAQSFQELMGIGGRISNPSRSLSVTFASTGAFQRVSHARHLRFDRWGFSVDKGCDLFATPILSEDSPSQYGDIRSLRKREHGLEQATGADSLRVRVWPS
jgi:hypothetical protein